MQRNNSIDKRNRVRDEKLSRSIQSKSEQQRVKRALQLYKSRNLVCFVDLEAVRDAGSEELRDAMLDFSRGDAYLENFFAGLGIGAGLKNINRSDVLFDFFDGNKIGPFFIFDFFRLGNGELHWPAASVTDEAGISG